MLDAEPAEAGHVDGLAQAHEGRLEVEGLELVHDAVVEGDDRRAHPGRLWRQCRAELGGVGDEDAGNAGIPAGHGIGARRVLNEDAVAVGGQRLLGGDDTQSAAAGYGRHLAGLPRVNRHLVTQALQVLSDGQQVGLRAAERSERLVSQDDPDSR